jgi:hypothetical protein
LTSTERRSRLFTLMARSPRRAIMLTLENKNFLRQPGQGYLLTAIASVLIGGTSIFGAAQRSSAPSSAAVIIGMIEAGTGRRRSHRCVGAHDSGSGVLDRHDLLSLCRRAASAVPLSWRG